MFGDIHGFLLRSSRPLVPRGERSEIAGVLVPRLYSHIIKVSLNAFVFHIMLLFPFILMADGLPILPHLRLNLPAIS
jgi:hypothetical protein